MIVRFGTLLAAIGITLLVGTAVVPIITDPYLPTPVALGFGCALLGLIVALWGLLADEFWR